MRKVSRRRLAQVVVSLLSDKKVSKSHVLQMLAAYLIVHKQQKHADLVLLDIAREYATQQGHLYADVASAFPLDAAARTELSAYLQQQTGARTIELNEAINTSLLAGVIVRTSDEQLDTSAATKLNRLTTAHLTTPREARGE